MKTIDFSNRAIHYILEALEDHVGYQEDWEDLSTAIVNLLIDAPEKTETYTFYGIDVAVDKEWVGGGGGEAYCGYFENPTWPCASQSTREELMLQLAEECYQRNEEEVRP